MSIVSRDLPAQPSLDVPKREARALLTHWRAANPEALDRIRGRHPRFANTEDAAIIRGHFKLADAQLVLAREYGHASWPELKLRIKANEALRALAQAIRRDDRAAVREILQQRPDLLHVPVVSGNWGPPMSHAANLGRIEIIQECAALGARDYQHAFDRALLQGQLECAHWLQAHGATLTPDLIAGPCETLNPDGLRFLLERQVPLCRPGGDRFAPLVMILGTYCRAPERKHACLELLEPHYDYPDTPIMAFHRGRLDDLKRHLTRDPDLLQRRFAYSEIYPRELGCPDDGRSGMCGTPVAGGTLLHLAIDFDEQEIFDWLIAAGADTNARSAIDAEGFGGQPPLFNALVSCAVTNGRQDDAVMIRTLLAHGADRSLRATLRKFLDWVAEPGWHVARNVTALEWAQSFPMQGWINREGVKIVSSLNGDPA